MKAEVLTMFVVVSVLGCVQGNVARAQESRVDPLVVVIDSNKDGIIDVGELRGAPVSIRTLDLNNDGAVSRDEASGREKQNRGGGSRLGGYTVPPPANNVPDHLFNIIVGRLTASTATVRVLFHQSSTVLIQYGDRSGSLVRKTGSCSLEPGAPVDFVLEGLKGNTRYFYRLVYTVNAQQQKSEEYSFHTQRAKDTAFVFTVQADSHLDENTSGEVYLRTLHNACVDQPDFHFGLGDTFMTGKYVSPELSQPQYLAQRYYLGQLCHSAAFYFALGNHDGEGGSKGSNVWATQTRKKYFPNPCPNTFFTGNDNAEPEVGLPENYYAFEWGNAQFIVLDPFRYTTTKTRGGDSGNWYWTLGENQYQWLARTLKQSSAELRFVFIHHLVGGTDRNQRGGAEAAPYWEWGGKGVSGDNEFAIHRAQWEKPIHDLLVDNGVDIVFHGHDHMFIHQQLDGIVYQLVPQPGHPRSGTKSAKEYGYLSGEVQGSSGHVRVRVSASSARVDYVRAYLPEANGGKTMNGSVSYSYVLPVRTF